VTPEIESTEGNNAISDTTTHLQQGTGQDNTAKGKFYTPAAKHEMRKSKILITAG